MFTILGADGKEYGPVTAGKLHEWIAGGRANLQTKARRDGETEWKTLADFPEFSQFGTGGSSGAPVAPASPPAIPVASMTGGPVPAGPTAAPAPLTGTAREIADDLIARAAPLDVFGCLGQSFELWKSNFFPLVGVTLLICLIQAVANMIPFLGFFTGVLLSGVFYGGLYYYYLGKLRGEPREVGDAFAGFTKAFVPLMLASLLTTVLILAVLVPFFFPVLAFVVAAAMHTQAGPPPHVSALALGGILVGCLPLLYLSISWCFTFMLIIDKGLGPWTAMEVSRRVVTTQWFRVFFVMLFGAILTMLGLIGLIIGIFFTLPLMIGSVVWAYENLCNPPPRTSAGI